MLDQKTKQELYLKFIKQFRKSQCMWNPENIYYYNKDAKENALLALLQLWNKYEPMTEEALKRKIQGIRSMYRRERKKVESNPGLYKPTLWYYKHLNFLSGNAEPTSDDSDSDNNDDDTLYVQLPRAQKRPASTSIDQLDAQGTSVDASAAAFGRSVGAQLHYLSKMQRCIAEKLISDVIYHAKMEQLSLDSTINVKDNLDASLTLMAEADPSIYGTALETSTSIQQPTSSTELTPEELVKREIAETESAVSFIKMEHNDTENYFFHDDEQNDDIDIVKEELM